MIIEENGYLGFVIFTLIVNILFLRSIIYVLITFERETHIICISFNDQNFVSAVHFVINDKVFLIFPLNHEKTYKHTC